MKKKIIVIATICLIFASSMTTFAAGGTKILPCDNCGQRNFSFGSEEGHMYSSCGRPAGVQCDACNKAVPKGQYHSYQMKYDRYFFLCRSSRCKNLSVEDRKYSGIYLNSIFDHSIDYVK